MAAPQPTITDHLAHLAESQVERSMYFVADTTKGSVTLLICEDCSYISAECNHAMNKWDPTGTKLTCRLCGLDGT